MTSTLEMNVKDITFNMLPLQYRIPYIVQSGNNKCLYVSQRFGLDAGNNKYLYFSQQFGLDATRGLNF